MPQENTNEAPPEISALSTTPEVSPPPTAPVETPSVSPSSEITTAPASNTPGNSVEAKLPNAPNMPIEPPPSSEPIISSKNNSLSFITRGLEKIRFRKRAKLDKIVAFAVKNGSIANDDVEKLLHVSDSTAQRYLMELVRQGKLKRVEKHSLTRYEPV